MSTEIDEAHTDEAVEPDGDRPDEQAADHRMPLDDEPPAPDFLISQDPVHPGSGFPRAEAVPEPPAAGRPLLAREAESEFLGRWTRIQLSFVEDPHRAVQDADSFIREIAAGLLRSFEDRRSELAAGWRFASDTEQLRLALRQYRVFVDVLLPGETS